MREAHFDLVRKCAQPISTTRRARPNNKQASHIINNGKKALSLSARTYSITSNIRFFGWVEYLLSIALREFFESSFFIGYEGGAS